MINYCRFLKGKQHLLQGKMSKLDLKLYSSNSKFQKKLQIKSKKKKLSNIISYKMLVWSN